MIDTVRDVFCWLFSGGCLQDFYASELRSNFFNGFLSLAAFMLAAKTFIVIHMKKEVYDHEGYRKAFQERKIDIGEKAAKRYEPLERMSNALFWVVVTSVVAAIGQVTVGLLPVNVAAITCIFLVIVALYKFSWGLWLIKTNLDSWFKMLHKEEAQEDIEKPRS